MGQMAVRTVLNFFCAAVFEIAAAFAAQKIKRAVAEKTVKLIIVRRLVAGEIFTFAVAEKSIIILHK